ncbi:MAG: hypothetical protein IPI64_14105 [Chloracidobacterium sp.]|nr:hypothetical protein [Chloracidobacterium sp.]
MLEQIKKFPEKALQILRSDKRDDARGSLKNVEQELRKEWNDSLSFVSTASCLDPEQNESVQTVIENLTECHTTIRRLYNANEPVAPQAAATVIATQLSNTQKLIRAGAIGDRAKNIANKTGNLLFAASQEIQSTFGVKGHANKPEAVSPSPVQSVERKAQGPVMELPSAMMFGLRQSLFPAERMIVGAGRRSAGRVAVEALFDVTGIASPGGVKADPGLLGQALIAMSQSGTYFALWIHSHPGSGPGATHPSTIDLRQHADWLKNYSTDLVSAIMVADRYLRFWGTALDTGTIAVSITGDGVVSVSAREHIYKLEV